MICNLVSSCSVSVTTENLILRTSNLSITSFKHPDNVHTIYLLDTPGFDHTGRSDIDILTNITI